MKITAEERGGDIAIFVNGMEIPFTRQAINGAGLDHDDLELSLMKHGLPAYRFESEMLLDYAVDYYGAGSMLSEIMFFRPPHLFNLGHSYELGMKAVIVLLGKIKLNSLYPDPGHDLEKLRTLVIKYLGNGILDSNELLIKSFNKLYCGFMGDSKFFVKYPDRSHLYAKWPEQTPESISALSNESDKIIEWLYSRFNDFGWPTRQRPNKSMHRSRPQ